MPHPLYTRLAGLKAKLAQQKDANLSEMLDVCEQLFELIEQNRNDLTESFEAHIKIDQRLNALEKHASTYHEPRG